MAADGETEIVRELLDGSPTPSIAAFFVEQRAIAELTDGVTLGISIGVTAILLRLHCDMKLHLFGEFAIELASA
jgi:hypothetical protein